MKKKDDLDTHFIGRANGTFCDELGTQARVKGKGEIRMSQIIGLSSLVVPCVEEDWGWGGRG